MDIVTKKSLSLSPIVISQTDQTCVKQVYSLTFFGVTFSSDLKWNIHAEKVIKKASKRIFVLRNLRRGNCSSVVMWRSYVTLIRTALVYAFPCFCNASKFLMDKLFRVEKRVCRIINSNSVCVPSLPIAADSIRERLFAKVLEEQFHPFRAFFYQRGAHCTRSSSDIQRPFAKTRRFSASFIIRFCR